MSARPRSPSPRPRKRQRISRSPTSSSDESPPLPHGARPISEKDYYAKNDEFRVWLKEEKRKYFDELSGEKAHSYFRKFVKAWNRGKLSRSLYAGINPTEQASSSQTSFKWSFAQKSNKVEKEALDRARQEVGGLTWGSGASSSAAERSSDRKEETGKRPVAGPSMPPPGRLPGPSLPSASDLRYAQETASELHERDRRLQRSAEKREAKDRLEELAPREVGRERMLEKKRERREADRSFRDAREGDAGLEVDEGSLMGGDSFQDRIRQRDAARAKAEERKRALGMERNAERAQRAQAMKAKESETMEMLKRLAKERFGGG